MKVDELIEILQEAKKKHGNMDIVLYNAMSYDYEHITEIKKTKVKVHPTCSDILCNTRSKWMGEAQTIFNKTPVQEVLYLN